MASNGWFKLHNALFQKAIWVEGSLAQRVIIVTILSKANWKEHKWVWKGKPYVCKPGQFITSYRKLAKECGVGLQALRNTLNNLQTTQFITLETTQSNSLVTIVNWDTYQSTKQKRNTVRNTGDNTQTTHSTTPIEDIRPKTTNLYPLALEKIWSAYPNRKNQSKKKAYVAYQNEIKEQVPLKTVLTAIERQKKSKAWKQDGGQFIPHCSTWINGRMWESESDADDKPKYGTICKKCKRKVTALTEGYCRSCYG